MQPSLSAAGAQCSFEDEADYAGSGGETSVASVLSAEDCLARCKVHKVLQCNHYLYRIYYTYSTLGQKQMNQYLPTKPTY